MRNIKIFGGPLNEMEFEVDVIPRIGERIEVAVGSTGDSAKLHYFRVHDVHHRLDNSPGNRVAVFVLEEDESKLLPQ